MSSLTVGHSIFSWGGTNSPPLERGLWIAVLLQSLRDLWLAETRGKGQAGVRRNAERFIFHDEYFLTVCRFASIDPKGFREKTRRLLEIGRASCRERV